MTTTSPAEEFGAGEFADYRRACDAFSRGDEAEAVKILNALAAADAQLWEVYNDLGVLACSSGDVSSALLFLQKACSFVSAKHEARMNLALVQKLEEQYETALSTLSPLLRLRLCEPEVLILVKEILGASPTLAAVVWARLVADLRALPPDCVTLGESNESEVQVRQGVPANRHQNDYVGGVDSTAKSLTSSSILESKTGNAPDFYLVNSGYCHCCRSETSFESRQSWLRDHYFCLKCHSIPRQRHIQYVLDRYFSGWEKLNIHESSPSNILISQYCTSYSSSYFFSDTICGEEKNGVRCENLEQLTFPDNTFDIFITQDVFEHIFNPDVAAKEIVRVLKPEGIHIFTAPKHKTVRKSYARAALKDGAIEYLSDAQYHGNPIGDGRSLVTWDYGDDFEFLLCEWSKCPTMTYVTRDAAVGIDGEYLEVFVTRKPNT